MKRIKIAIFALVLLFGVLLASCGVTDTSSQDNTTPSASETNSSGGTLHYHIYGDWYVKIEPTDSSTGLRVRTCSICGYEQSQTIDKLEHTHTYETTWTSDDDYHWHASSCGHYVVSEKSLHDYSSWVTVKEATETSTGLLQRTCNICGYAQSLETMKHTHTYEAGWTCDDDYHWHASLCGHDVVREKGLHDYGPWDIYEEATETSTGLKIRTCSICGYHQFETIDKLEHTHKYETTWTKDENYHWHASSCGHDVVNEKASHTFGDWRYAQYPTTTSTGLMSRYCSVCNYREDKVIEQIKYETTYTSDENYHWYASNNPDFVSGKKRHSFANWIIVSNATTTSTGLTKRVCSVCGYEDKKEIPKLDPSEYFTITWVNWDGTVLEIDENVHYGSTPSYDGETPTRESTAKCNFKFNGWDPTIDEETEVTKNQTYTAQFIETYNFHFDLNGGTSPSYVKSRVVTSLDAKNFFFNVTKDEYKFRGWSYNDIEVFDENCNLIENVELLPEMTFKAIFKQTNKVTIISNMDNAGEISQSGEYPYYTFVDLYAHPYQGYEFLGWYSGYRCISTEENYRCALVEDDVLLEARFDYASYYAYVESYNPDCGLVKIYGVGDTNTYYRASGTYAKESEKIVIIANSIADIDFLGWYDSDNNLVSTDAIYTFLMPNHKYTLIAKWNYFTISYKCDSDVEFDDTVLKYYTTEMTNLVLQEPKKTGYTFLGWYYNDEKYTEIDPNSVTNYKFVAKFTPSTDTKYVVNHYQQNLDGTYSSIPTETDNLVGTTNTNTNAKLKGYDGFTAPNLKQTNINADGSTVINLYYKRNTYQFSVSINNSKGGSITSNTSSSYLYDDFIILSAILNDGYTFNGWFINNEIASTDLEYTFNMPANDINVEARYTVNTYTVTIDYGNYCYSGKASYEVEYDSPFTFPIAKESSKEYSYTSFEGWKYNNKLVTDSSGYIENWDIPQNIKMIPSFTEAEDNVLYFGSYPQTEVTAKLLIDDLNEKAGELPSESNLNLWKDYGYYNAGNIESYMYYIDIDLNDDNLYDYRGVYFTKYRPYSTSTTLSQEVQDRYDTTHAYIRNKVYWFKYDSIKWRILEQNDDKVMILSDLILDSQDYQSDYVIEPIDETIAYDASDYIRENAKDYQGNISGRIYANNYKYSHIRSWLNTSFYDTAFSSLQKEIIEITNVDNSLKSTSDSNNKNTCENTDDKMFLLSKEEINKYFTSDSERQAGVTAYALCQGFDNYDHIYWLRSPYYIRWAGNHGFQSWFVNDVGHVEAYGNSYSINCTDIGVRPACWINL